jgi:hypothetical protein
MYYWNAPGGPYTLQPHNQVLKDNIGYWVWIDRDNTVSTSGVLPVSENVHLVAGWNLVHFSVVDSDTPDNVFIGLTYFTNYLMYYWNAPGGPYTLQPHNQVLKDNIGYWVWIDRDNTLTLP